MHFALCVIFLFNNTDHLSQPFGAEIPRICVDAPVHRHTGRSAENIVAVEQWRDKIQLTQELKPKDHLQRRIILIVPTSN